jgi:pimeloyl-ACP methyl ester carboxylesterase
VGTFDAPWCARHGLEMDDAFYEDVEGWSGPGRLLRVRGSAKAGVPVVVTHGTFSDASTCVPIAHFFGQLCPTYVIEWRARDIGWGHVQRFDYTDLALDELCSAFAHVQALHGGSVHFVAHSGGGLAVLLALALKPDVAQMLRSMTIIAAQATWRNPDWRSRVSVAGMERLGRCIGYWPKRFLSIGPCSESGTLKSNWVAWTKAGCIFDRDRRDVLAMVRGQKVPSLVLAGAADHDIAPPHACQPIAAALGAQFEVCGKATGHGEDFTHPRIFKSRAAAQTVFPMIADWIAAQ